MPFKSKANKKELVTSKYRIQNLNKKGFVLVFKVIKHIIIISSITVDLNVSHYFFKKVIYYTEIKLHRFEECVKDVLSNK